MDLQLFVIQHPLDLPAFLCFDGVLRVDLSSRSTWCHIHVSTSLRLPAPVISAEKPHHKQYQQYLTSQTLALVQPIG